MAVQVHANGQQTTTIDAVGNLSSTAFYADGLVQSKTDGAGDLTSYGYDAVGNATTVTSPNANAAGNSSPANTPTYNFYTWDNLLMESEVPVSSADGVKQRSTCYYFDAAGRKTGEGDVPYTGSLPHTTGQCPASPPAQSLAFTYFPADRLDVETGRDGTSARDFAYDAAGNQVAAVGNTPSIWVSPTYYADGLLRTVNDGEGRTQSYAWDGAGQMTGRNSASSATAFLTTMTYTDAELPASENGFIAPGTPSTWTYDAGGRPLHETDNGTVISYVYAPDGSVSQMGQTWSPHINFVDGDYRVTQDGCLTCQDAPSNGVGYVWNYQYDAAGRMTAMQSVGTGGPWQYARYDPSGNRLSHTDALSGATTTYAYNLDDTIATSTLVGSAAFADTYTTPGLLSTDGCLAYTPDAFDRTQAVAGQSGAPQACGTAPATTTYSYDALDRQVQTASGSTTTTIHDDGLSSRELVESTGVGVDTGYQLTAAGTVLGVDRTSPSTLEFLSSDTKGSVSTSMSPSGAPGCQIQYDPFGQVVSSTSNVCETDSGGHQPATSSDVLYRNLHRDSTTGTYQMGARTYDPSKNTFLEPDHYRLGQPIQDVGLATDPLTRNARVYVDGDPVNHIDPTGHSYTTDDGTDNQGSSSCSACYIYPTQYQDQWVNGQPTQQSVSEMHQDMGQAVQQDNAAATQQAAEAAIKPGFRDAPAPIWATVTLAMPASTLADGRPIPRGFLDGAEPAPLPSLQAINACNAAVPYTYQLWAGISALPSDSQSGLLNILTSDPRNGCSGAAARYVASQYGVGPSGVNAVDYLLGAGTYIRTGGLAADLNELRSSGGGGSSGGDVLYHGTDAESARDIIENGISREGAAAKGGGDVFWTTEDPEMARLFAAANPSLAKEAGVVGIRLPGTISQALSSRLIRFDEQGGAYVVDDWEAFNAAVEFFPVPPEVTK